METRAKAIPNPRERARALGLLDQVRASQARIRELREKRGSRKSEGYFRGRAELDLQRLPLTTGYPSKVPPPDFRQGGIRKLVRLLLAVPIFLALCVVGLFLIAGLTQLLDSGLDSYGFAFLIICILEAVGLIWILQLLSRKPTRDRQGLSRNPVARKFRRQKLQFQLASLCLVAALAVAIAWASPMVQGRVSLTVLSILSAVCFVTGYSLLGCMLWRCPACNTALSFLSKMRDRQSIPRCPRCEAVLQ